MNLVWVPKNGDYLTIGTELMNWDFQKKSIIYHNIINRNLSQ